MVCYTLTMQDSWGDGWNGNTWHWVDASGGDTTGTLSSGSSGTAQLCFPGNSCYTFYVDDSGSYPSEVSWTVTDSAGSTVAAGGADNTNHQICPPVGSIVVATSSFETNLDGWTDTSFLRKSGNTPSSNTGPSAAADGSFYVYAETSSPNDNGAVFDLEKAFPAVQELYGVAFQYHMYGTSMGSAVLESSATGTSWDSLWTKSGNLGDQWNQATVYAGSGQTMLRYTCVTNGRGVTSCDKHSSPLLLALPSRHQVHVRIKLDG